MRTMLIILSSVISLMASSGLLAKSADAKFINTETHDDAMPFSEAVLVNNLLFLSGQIGEVPGTGKLVAGGMKAEAKQTMDNIKGALERMGYSMDDIIKCTVMIDDISLWGEFNKVYVTYFKKPYPARSAFGANGLAIGAALEVECIAYVGD